MNVTIEGQFIHFKAPHHVGRAMNAVYSKAKGTYRVPLTLGALRELYKAGYDVEKIGRELNFQRNGLLSEKAFAAPNTHDQLRDYQKQDVNFLLQRNALANFSEMRTGEHYE